MPPSAARSRSTCCCWRAGSSSPAIPGTALLARFRVPTLKSLLESFLGHDSIETTALLRAIAVLGWPSRDGDRIAVELVRRNHTLPRWLESLDPMTVREVMTLGHVLGDGEDYLLACAPAPAMSSRSSSTSTTTWARWSRTPSPSPPPSRPWRSEHAAIWRTTPTPPLPSVTVQTPRRAFARRSRPAITSSRRSKPPPGRSAVPWWSGRWAECPGAGRATTTPGSARRRARPSSKRFLASAQAADLDEVQRDLVDPLVWFCAGHRSGDPLRWSPVVVEIALLDFFPRKVLVPPAELARVPGLIRAFVRFAHTERGVRPVHTDATVAAVDRLETEFLAMVRERRVRPRHAFDDGRHPADLALEALAAQFGGVEALRHSTTGPFPTSHSIGRASPGISTTWSATC